MRLALLYALLFLAVAGQLAAAETTGPAPCRFEKIVLNDAYLCDGVTAADINRDGTPDIVAGPFWYEGPKFKQKHEFYPAKVFATAPSPTDSMFSYVHDFNGDGWADILVLGRVHLHAAYWFENPGPRQDQEQPWKKHFVFERIKGESPPFTDVDGDGRPEIVAHWENRWGLIRPDWTNPTKTWEFTPITAPGDYPQFYHGTGIGDVNGDGRLDLVLNDGWWEQPAKASQEWSAHPFKFGDKGGAQMFVYDVDGDRRNDVITALDAHGWGLAWFRQVEDGKFQKHVIMGDRSEEARYGVAFTQPHALALADVDGDGLKDILVGKRLWAHGPQGDIEPTATPVVYWFQLRRDPTPRFIPRLIDDHSGVGVQITTADLNDDGRPDLLTTSKLGAFLFLNRPAAALPSAAEDGYFPPPESAGGWRKLEDDESIRTRTAMDPRKLGELRDWLLSSDDRDFAAVIVRAGWIVLEVERGNSAKTDARRVASVSKAICATVLAIASERSQPGSKKMNFDDPAFQFIPWAQPLSDPRKAQITVKQLLNHTSGLCPEAAGAPNDGSWDYVLGHTGDARTAQLAFDPGTACGYSTHALAHAALVCETVTGQPYDQFAIDALFKPIGIEHWWFQYYDGTTGRHPSHGLGLPARDLARVAYCMLRDGQWNEGPIIPKWFVEQTAASTHNVQGPEMRFKIDAQIFSHAWELPARLHGPGRRQGQGIPPDARSKPGSGGQLIAFVPSLDLVVTRQTGSSGDWEYEEYLRRACAAVLDSLSQ